MSREIPAIYHPSHSLHQPKFEIFNGEKKPHKDISQRAEVILAALQNSGFADIHISQVDDVLPFVSRVHEEGYLNYLKNTSVYAGEVAKRKNNPDFSIYPSIHPYVPYAQANNFVAHRGRYIFDTYTPIMKETYAVASHSAGVALAGAMLLHSGEPLVYCLNRPGGHHAQRSVSGGMCYMNNAAVAAEYLLSIGASKIAIFDIDLHHGSGTQDIFYEKPNVLVANIHADPTYTFPHFSGYPNELGSGNGYGTNRNFPLPPKTSNQQYHATVQRVLTLIKDYQPEYLLISAGFDTHEDDPVGNFRLTTGYYQELGESIKKLDLPTLVLQEGGYAIDSLGLNVVTFLSGLLKR